MDDLIYDEEGSTNFDSSDNLMKKMNDNKEEAELDNQSIDVHTLNQEKKRKKVTDEITQVASKKKKKYENSLYKQPTVEELNQLRETENLFHSNLFRFQIEEVLNEVKLKDKYKALFEIWFERLKAVIESIEETEEISVSNMTIYIVICYKLEYDRILDNPNNCLISASR